MIFRPSLLPTLAAGAALAVLMSLGFWQLDRADQKRALHEAYRSQAERPRCVLPDGCGNLADMAALTGRAARLPAPRAIGPRILLDNQVLRGAAGYLVLQPVALTEGSPLLLVAMGWIALGPSRDQAPVLPDEALPASLDGVIARPPAAGIDLGGELPLEPLAEGIVRTARLSVDQLSEALDRAVLPVVLQADPDPRSAYRREWIVPGVDDAKHVAYATQWFSMAAIVAFLYVWLNLRRRPPEGDAT